MNSATLIGATAVLMWATLASFAVLSSDMPPFQVTAMALAIGGAFGLIVTAARGRLAALAQPWPVYAFGVGGIFFYHALYFAALRNAPAAEAGLVAYLWPLLIVLMSALLPGERLTARHVLGAVLGLAGAATLILSRGGGERFSGAWFGDLLALGCAFTWSSYSVLSRRMKDAPTEVVAGFCLISAMLAFLCHWAFEPTRWPEHVTGWAAVLGLGLLPLGLAFYVWDFGVKHGDIKLLGVASYAAPLLSTLLLIALGLAEASPALGVAAALIVGGAAIAAWRPKAAPQKEKAGARPA